MSSKGQTGGPIANPIRTMLGSKSCDGVRFNCYSEKKASNTRFAAIMLKRRNGYKYKTTINDNILTVYKEDADPFELHSPIKVNFSEEDFDSRRS